MARFRVQLSSPLPASESWNRILDLRAHDRVIPLTRITEGMVTAAELRPGSRFVARTGAGPLAFDDVMVVDTVTPPRAGEPGRARIHKEGTMIRGSIELWVAPDGPGSQVSWTQDIHVRGVPRALGRLTAGASRAAYGWALRRLLSAS